MPSQYDGVGQHSDSESSDEEYGGQMADVQLDGSGDGGGGGQAVPDRAAVPYGFSSSTGNAFTETSEKVGWLYKKGGGKEKGALDILKGGRRRNWKRRWFVIEGTDVIYYSTPQDRSSQIPEKGRLVLNEYSLMPDLGAKEGESSQEHGFRLVTLPSAAKQREFSMASESASDKEDWLKHLKMILDRVSGQEVAPPSAIESATLAYRRGNKALLEKDYAAAAAEYTAAIGFNPAYEDAYYNRGISYLNGGGQIEQAVASFTQVLKMNPSCASAYNNRGIAFKQLGELSKAVADYREALKIDPEDAYARKNVALVEAELANPSASKLLGNAAKAGVGAITGKGGATTWADCEGEVYRQTQAHHFVKRYLKLSGGVLADLTGGGMPPFSAEMSKLRSVLDCFDDPYCSTCPECELQVSFQGPKAGSLITVRLRTTSPQSKQAWLGSLAGTAHPQ